MNDHEPASPPKAGPDAQLPLWPDASQPEATETTPLPAAEPAPDDPAWRLSDLGLFVAFAFGALLFANAVTSGIFLLLRNALGWNRTLEEAFSQAPYLVGMQVIWESLWLVFIYYTLTLKYRQPFWKAIRWLPSPHGSKVFVLAGIVLAAGIQALFRFFPTEERLPIERLFTSPASGYLLAFFGICVAPFMEELVFRGFFYPVFERRWGIAAAVLISALLFALIHAPQLSGGPSAMAAIFLVGLALSYARARTGSLMPAYFMHLGYNASLFVSLYLATDQFRALQG